MSTDVQGLATATSQEAPSAPQSPLQDGWSGPAHDSGVPVRSPRAMARARSSRGSCRRRPPAPAPTPPAERGDQGLIEEPFAVDVSGIHPPEALGTQAGGSSTPSRGRTGVLGLCPRA
jgi:hypothetical protein